MYCLKITQWLRENGTILKLDIVFKSIYKTNSCCQFQKDTKGWVSKKIQNGVGASAKDDDSQMVCMILKFILVQTCITV